MSSLASKAVSGVLWSTGLNVFRDFLQFGVMLILVRLLAPEAYGQFGLVSAIMGFLAILSFRAFLEYTLQIRPGGQIDYQMHFTAGAVVQAALFVITNLAAMALKHLPSYAQVAMPVHVMSLTFVLDLGSEFRVKMLEREMNWKRLRILQGIGVTANAAVSMIMAYCGAGVYALLVPALLIQVPAIVDLFFLEGWRPTWRWDAVAFGPARSYGFTRLMSAVVIWSRQLLEGTLLVKIAGFTGYGIYGRALGLAAICCLKVPSLLMNALFPVLTKLHPGSDSSNRASRLVFCSVAWSTFPAAVIFSVLASPVVHTLYGAKWAGAIPYLPWAMAAGAATALTQTGSLVLVANFQQKRSLYIDGITLVGTAAGLFFLAPRSLTLYLIGTAAVQSAAFAVMLATLYRRQLIDGRGIVNALVLPAVSAGGALLVLELVRAAGYASRDTFGGAILYGLEFSAVYLLLLRLGSRQQCREVVHLLPGRSYLERWLALGT